MVNSRDKFIIIQENDNNYLAEPIFQQKKPGSRVILDVVTRLQQIIKNSPSINHDHFIEYQRVEQVNGEYCLITSTSKKYYPLEDYLNQNNPSLCKKLDWALNIVEVAKKAEEEKCDWPQLTLYSFKVDDDGNIKIVNPEITEIIWQYQQKETVNSACFIPPEIIKNEKRDEQSRLYSFGIILYYFCTGEVPFTGDNKADILDKILNFSTVEPRFINHQLSLELNDLILQLLTRSKEKRMSTWEKLLSKLSYIYDNNLIIAPESQQDKNCSQSKRIVKSLEIKDKSSQFFRKHWQLVTVVSVIFVIITATFFLGGSEPVITPETTPEEVVTYFYRAINEKNIIILDQTTALDLGRLEGMITEGHVVEKMRQAYQTESENDAAEISLEKDAMFGIRDFILTEQKGTSETSFIAEYIFFINMPEGPKTLEMKDKIILEYRTKWQIVDIKGDLVQLIRGELIFE